MNGPEDRRSERAQRASYRRPNEAEQVRSTTATLLRSERSGLLARSRSAVSAAVAELVSRHSTIRPVSISGTTERLRVEQQFHRTKKRRHENAIHGDSQGQQGFRHALNPLSYTMYNPGPDGKDVKGMENQLQASEVDPKKGAIDPMFPGCTYGASPEKRERPVRPPRRARRFLHYFFGFDDGRCDRALPAADFDGLDMRRCWSAEPAAEAALGDVAFAGALRCDNALPAADFDFGPVELDRNVEDAARRAGVLVTLALAILASWLKVNRIGLV